jgi:hypothetical protein
MPNALILIRSARSVGKGVGEVGTFKPRSVNGTELNVRGFLNKTWGKGLYARTLRVWINEFDIRGYNFML